MRRFFLVFPFLSFDAWEEVLKNLWNYRMRAGLTAFGVFWGVLMLAILQGVGKGLETGTMRLFGGLAVNSVWIWGGKTSMAYGGMQPGRRIVPTFDDLQVVKAFVPEVRFASPQTGMRSEYNVHYLDRNGNFVIHGMLPEFTRIQAVNVVKGRFLNPFDVNEKRKVCVIGLQTAEILFRKAEPIGKYLKINGVPFLVVGVMKARKIGVASEQENQRIYLPYTTMDQTFNLGNKVYFFGAAAYDGVSGSILSEKLRRFMAKRHNFHPNDPQAIGIDNTETDYNNLNGLFAALRIFTFVVGAGTLLAGMVGVSNVMLISVKERTREIGVKKALGARNGYIISLILMEALCITFLAGYLGLAAGFGVVEGITALNLESDYFADARVDLWTSAAAVVALTLSGAATGYLPARHAAAIDPIQALRYE